MMDFRYWIWQEDSDCFLAQKGVTEDARYCEVIAGFYYFYDAVQFVKDHTFPLCCFRYRIKDTLTCKEYEYEDIKNEFK